MIDTQISTAPGRRPRRPAAKRKARAKVRAMSDSGDRRANVLAAAQRVFEAKGLDGANMRAIAREAGYTVGALYFYYKSREEIYADLLSTSLKHLQTAALEASAAVNTPPDRAMACALAFYDYYATRPNEFSLAFYLFRGIGPHGLTHELNDRLNAELWATLAEVYRPLVEAGRNLDEALRDLTACFGHGVGLLLLTHTGRIRMFRQDGRELFRAFVERWARGD